MTDYRAMPGQWATDAARWHKAIFELRTRVEVLEDAAHKHIVETSANVLALASRVESLEAADRPGLKLGHKINEPLKLTPEQAQQITDLLTPNSKPAPKSPKLVKRVALAISGIEYGMEWEDEAVNWSFEARKAIREVAAWLREQHDGDLIAATVLEREAER